MLQSFQPHAGNDFKEAYAKYGDKLTFVTGIDIQRGEKMTPSELKGEIIENYRIGRTKGRHVLGTTHELQYSMPLENLRTIFQTVNEIQSGKYDN
jgi:uroporphyrinogen-III decarboxylase